VKKTTSRVRKSSSGSIQAKKLLILLKKTLHELKALHAEALAILNDLLITPSTHIVRGLCLRFQVIQEYFVLRYYEARSLAVAVLGDVHSVL
jgi:hypothetical protein